MAMISDWVVCLVAGSSCTCFLVLSPYSGAFSLGTWHDRFSNLLHSSFDYSISSFMPVATTVGMGLSIGMQNSLLAVTMCIPVAVVTSTATGLRILLLLCKR